MNLDKVTSRLLAGATQKDAFWYLYASSSDNAQPRLMLRRVAKDPDGARFAETVREELPRLLASDSILLKGQARVRPLGGLTFYGDQPAEPFPQHLARWCRTVRTRLPGLYSLVGAEYYHIDPDTVMAPVRADWSFLTGSTAAQSGAGATAASNLLWSMGTGEPCWFWFAPAFRDGDGHLLLRPYAEDPQGTAFRDLVKRALIDDPTPQRVSTGVLDIDPMGRVELRPTERSAQDILPDLAAYVTRHASWAPHLARLHGAALRPHQGELVSFDWPNAPIGHHPSHASMLADLHHQLSELQAGETYAFWCTAADRNGSKIDKLKRAADLAHSNEDFAGLVREALEADAGQSLIQEVQQGNDKEGQEAFARAIAELQKALDPWDLKMTQANYALLELRGTLDDRNAADDAVAPDNDTIIEDAGAFGQFAEADRDGNNCFIASIVQSLVRQNRVPSVDEKALVIRVAQHLADQQIRMPGAFIGPVTQAGQEVLSYLNRSIGSTIELTIVQWTSDLGHGMGAGLTEYKVSDGSVRVKILFTPSPGHFDTLLNAQDLNVDAANHDDDEVRDDAYGTDNHNDDAKDVDDTDDEILNEAYDDVANTPMLDDAAAIMSSNTAFDTLRSMMSPRHMAALQQPTNRAFTVALDEALTQAGERWPAAWMEAAYTVLHPLTEGTELGLDQEQYIAQTGVSRAFAEWVLSTARRPAQAVFEQVLTDWPQTVDTAL